MREAWTDERLDDLANRMDRGFEQVRAEMDREFTEVRAETKAGSIASMA